MAAVACSHEVHLLAEHNPGGLMEATLRRLGEVDIVPSPGESKFVHPQTVMYHLDGAPPL